MTNEGIFVRLYSLVSNPARVLQEENLGLEEEKEEVEEK